MSSFSGKRFTGIMFAVLANSCFAATNLMASSYPSLGGLYLWRGLGSVGVLALRRRSFTKKGLILGFVHSAHMLAFLISIRIGPAWLAPAVLGGVPALLWFWGRQKNMFVNCAVVAMGLSAFLFSWGSEGEIKLSAAIFAFIAAILVAVRMHYASMWIGEYDSNASLLVAYGVQALTGVGFFLVGKDVTFILWMAAGMVVVGVVGHLALYETAQHCSPAIAAALAPLSVVLTAIGVIAIGGQVPSLVQGLSVAVWLACGVSVALVAQNIQIERRANRGSTPRKI